jgi:hypothetical protein
MDAEYERKEFTYAPFWLKWIIQSSERSLEPKSYWGDRYDDALHERVEGFLSGIIAGTIFGCVLFMFVFLVFQ